MSGREHGLGVLKAPLEPAWAKLELRVQVFPVCFEQS